MIQGNPADRLSLPLIRNSGDRILNSGLIGNGFTFRKNRDMS
jgi:hypothetical protein